MLTLSYTFFFIVTRLQAVKAEKVIQLTDQNPSWEPDQSGHGHGRIKPTISTTTHPWAVLLNGNVYVKDTGTDLHSISQGKEYLPGEGIWQYSIEENMWSPHLQPELLTRYTLTVFESRLTCLGGFMASKGMEYNRRVFSWNGREWTDGDVEQIPEEVELPSSDSEFSASSDDTHLYLALQKDTKVQILRYSRQGKWEKWEGPDCESSGSRIEISVINKTIFLTEHNDVVRTVIRTASVSSLSSSSVPAGHSIWTEFRGPGLSFFSNLTVSGGNILLLAPILRSGSDRAMLFKNVSSDHAAYWDKVGSLQISWELNSHPSIFGLGDETLLIIGRTTNPLRASAKLNVCVCKGKWL